MNKPKTYAEVIQQLIEVNDKLIDGKIEIEIAKQICLNVQVLVNAAKLQLEVCKYQNKTESEFLTEPESIDKTLKHIEENKKKPIKFGE